ncbi:MAG: PQQ-binding-like beta-propeller repeat protein, partial [Planctomycetota bacterium]
MIPNPHRCPCCKRQFKSIMRLSLCLLCFAAALTAQANDWPASGHDNARTAAAEEPLRLPLRQAWVHWAAQPPSPAWPAAARQDYWHKLLNLTPSVTYDRVFQVAAARGAVFFASSAGDEICCLDAATGARRWSFVTEGPVRLAPTLAGDKVLAGSDDGWVYCLAAADGTLAWRYRLGPREARLPGNGRMISRWPVRTGILVENGTGYCAGGLFPVTEGVYLAAFDVATGRE